MCLISGLGKQRHLISEFEASLIYKASPGQLGPHSKTMSQEKHKTLCVCVLMCVCTRVCVHPFWYKMCTIVFFFFDAHNFRVLWHFITGVSNPDVSSLCNIPSSLFTFTCALLDTPLSCPAHKTSSLSLCDSLLHLYWKWDSWVNYTNI